jgi:putative spermidine/putrescine transport system substrate-binding protein
MIRMKRYGCAAALLGLFLAGGARAQDHLVVAAYGGSFETLMRQAVIPPFEKANNVTVDYVAGNSSDNIAKLAAQKGHQEIGVAILDDGPMVQAASLGFCQKITDPVTQSLYPVAILADGAALGTGFGYTGIAYNTKIFAEKKLPIPNSWADLENPAFKQRLAIPGIDNTYGLHTLVMMARLNGGSETDIGPGFKAMTAKVNPNVLAYESSPGKMSELFQSGEIWLAVWGSSRVAAMQAAGFPLEMVRPKEGGVVLMTAGCVITGAPKPALAQKFLAFIESPEIQAVFAEKYGAGPTNKDTKLAPDIAAKVIYGEDQVKQLVAMDWATINANRTEWTRRWQREVER